MAIKIDISDKQATLIWCRGARACKGFSLAAQAGDKSAMNYYGTAMYMVLAQMADLAPEELRPDGNETDKP